MPEIVRQQKITFGEMRDSRRPRGPDLLLGLSLQPLGLHQRRSMARSRSAIGYRAAVNLPVLRQAWRRRPPGFRLERSGLTHDDFPDGTRRALTKPVGMRHGRIEGENDSWQKSQPLKKPVL